MKLVVGLGNPEEKGNYSLTRHNIGFIVVDALSDSTWKQAHQSKISKIEIENEKVLLVKPQTFMNLSGRAVKEIMHYYRIPAEDLLVVHDDIDQKFLCMKFQKNRGSGGHNGVKSIHECLGNSNYYRLKLGVGHSRDLTDPEYKKPTSSYVLSPFTEKEREHLKQFISRSAEAVQYFILNGGEKAGNIYNQKPSSEIL